MNERYKTIILSGLYTLVLLAITLFVLFINKDIFIFVFGIFLYILFHIIVLALGAESIWMFYHYLKEKYIPFLVLALILAFLFILLSWSLVQADMEIIGVMNNV